MKAFYAVVEITKVGSYQCSKIKTKIRMLNYVKHAYKIEILTNNYSMN